MAQIQLLTDAGRRTVTTLAEGLNATTPETLMFLCAHDDDACVGIGMTMALAVREGFELHVVVTTDGRLGYCSEDDKDDIVRTRTRECLQSYNTMGIPDEQIHFLGFGDGHTTQATGRWPASEGEPEIAGYTGLENHFTYILRKLRPNRIFTPASTDVHPDHQVVYRELLISIFHASAAIWPELGAPAEVPTVYEYPTYVMMAEDPDTMVEGDDEIFTTKLNAISCYKSQKQFGALVDRIREAGPVEFFRNLQFEFYNPNVYKKLFQ